MVSFTCDNCQDTFTKKKAEAHLTMTRCTSSVTCVDCSVSFTIETIKAHTSCVTETQKYAGNYLKKLPDKPKSPITPVAKPAPALLYGSSDSDSDIPVPTQAAPVKAKSWVPIISPTSTTPNGTGSFPNADSSSSDDDSDEDANKPRPARLDLTRIKRKAERQTRNSDRNYRRHNVGAAQKRSRTAEEFAAAKAAKAQRQLERDQRRQDRGLI